MELAVKSHTEVGAGPLEKLGKASSPDAPQEKGTMPIDTNNERSAEAAEGPANGKSGGANGELRSSSGECTSGESKTEKEGDSCRGGSSKDSGSQADENIKTDDNKDSGSAEGSDDGKELADSQKDDSTQANDVANDDATDPDDSTQKGGGKKPKLPRPEGNCPCPRCTSEDTKFCYYNNYNIKQPRYFCKGCQRYWTEGGMLRNVPVGAGRRNKNAKEQKKADKISPPAMANPIGPPLNAAGAYAHNRHVLWDGADPSHNGPCYSTKSANDPYSAMPPSYMHGGTSWMASRGGWPATGSDRTGNGNFSNGGSSNMSTRSYAGTQDIISTDAAGNANGSTVDMSGSGGADSPDGRGRKMRKHNGDQAPMSGMHGGADYNHSGLMHSSASGTVNYDHPVQGGSHSYPAHGRGGAATEAEQGHTPMSSSSMPVMSSDGRSQGQGEGPWMMHPAHHPAAAAAAAYQAAASGQQSSYWSNMPPWNYHWGNSAVAGWAAAAAAVYQAGASSACWPPNGSWNPMENSSITPGAPMGSGPSSMMQHPGMPQQQSSHYSGSSVQGNYPPGPAMMGYPGPSTPWNGNNNMMPMMPSHNPMPSHGGMMHQGRMQSQAPPPGAVSGIPHHPYTVAQQLVSSNGQHRGSQGVLGKHMRSFD